VTEPAVFLYDGDCAFCTRCAGFLRRHVSTPVRAMPWQSVDLTLLPVTAAQCAAAVQYVAPGRVSAGPVAIADLLRTATGRRGRGWRAAGWLLSTRPVLVLAWPAYRWVARNRHRMPGGSAYCELGSPRPTGLGPEVSARTAR
jgi:predicted DCC family thiol-disulfide oxidoreductase YuxK